MQQVAGQFAQHPVVGPYRCSRRFHAEIQIAFGDQGRQVQGHGAGDFPQVHRGCTRLLAQLLHLGQRQHLVGQQGRTVHRVADIVQGLVCIDIPAQG